MFRVIDYWITLFNLLPLEGGGLRWGWGNFIHLCPQVNYFIGKLERYKNDKEMYNLITRLGISWITPLFQYCVIVYFHICKDYCIYLGTDLSLRGAKQRSSLIHLYLQYFTKNQKLRTDNLILSLFPFEQGLTHFLFPPPHPSPLPPRGEGKFALKIFCNLYFNRKLKIKNW